MKTEREQIEEMAKQMCKEFETDVCKYVCPYMNTCSNKDTSNKLYAAGYRKASDVIDEFVERMKEENEISFRRYGKGIGISTIFRIADEMRQEVK